ncbi:hypothetical protein AXG94_26610 [Pseudomonas corrugata]|nr:hypothetical protein AXG94_26610 [Pseudomonas corrugata]
MQILEKRIFSMDATAVQEPAFEPPSQSLIETALRAASLCATPSRASCPCLPPVLLLPASVRHLAVWVNSMAAR